MGLTNRPYIGTWQLNNRKVVKFTPDALVYVNGDTSVAGCPTCYGKIDLQPYITSVSVDPSTEGPATATMSLSIPYHMGDSLVRDGNFILRPGLEVHIYLRGYFPTKGILANTSPADTGGVDMQNAVMYPYYLVFHGVMTDVNYEYSSGEHTATISCTDMLHFWQYQIVSTNGALFGARPDNSKVRMSLVGHNLTGMSPYSIIYTLFRDVGGAAGGVAFALSNETNAAARSTVTQDSLFNMNLLYWSRRFSESMTSLRMYGADGSLYNAFDAAFLGTISGEQVKTLAKKYADKENQRTEFDPVFARKAKAIGFDPYTLFSGAASDKDDGLGINVAQLQAFVSDIGQWGQVNLFESVYETKLEIANAVKEVTGFEFYQDVDGDIVFKPPFYNLNTESSRVYRIEPIDISNFSTREGEPEATVVKATSGHFQNLKVGGGLEAEWGTRAEFIDYRLVAQFGWRQKSLGESSYYSQRRALFFACVAQMDLFNINVKSASCTIPIRPELRPGYPVYVTHLDCYYYLSSFSHSFQFGGQCMTTLNLSGKRAKFYAPGKAPGNGIKATIDAIDLSNPHLPSLPLEIAGNDGEIPRLQGFPNVVMTLDPELVNPLTFFRGITAENFQTEDAIRTLVNVVLSARTGILEVDGDTPSSASDAKSAYFNGPWKLKSGENTYIKIGTIQTLTAEAQSVNADLSATNKIKDNKKRTAAQEKVFKEKESVPFVRLLEAAKTVADKVVPGADATAAYLELLSDYKATYHPGSSLPGYYRYYSASHPEPTMQGPFQLARDENGDVKPSSLSRIGESTITKSVLQFDRDGSNRLVAGEPVGGIPIKVPGSKDSSEVVPTHLITTFQIAVFEVDYEGSRVVSTGNKTVGFPTGPLSAAYTEFFQSKLLQDTPSAFTALSDYKPLYDEIVADVQPKANLSAFGWTVSSSEGYEGVYTFPTFDGATTVGDLPGDGPEEQVLYAANIMASSLANAVATTLLNIKNGTNAKTLTVNFGGSVDVYPAQDSNKNEDFAESSFVEAWGSCWPLKGVVQTSRQNKQSSKQTTKSRKHAVPVFPVSDERGYSVVGTYRYGRGLSIEAGGSFDKLQARDVTTNTSFNAVEEFLAEIQAGTDVAQVVGALKPEKRAELAAFVGGTDLVTDGGEIRVVDASGNLSSLGHSARPASTNQSTQKLTVTNAAYSLSDLQIADSQQNVCSCKGAEAASLFVAFGEKNNFVSVETEDINAWLLEQAASRGQEWAAVQAALRGEVLDTLTIAKQVSRSVHQARGILTTTENSLKGSTDFSTAQQRFAAAQDKLNRNNGG
jgi:hypothetical protein